MYPTSDTQTVSGGCPCFVINANRLPKEPAAPRSEYAGKREDVAALQDLLTYALQGLALVAVEGRKVGVVDQAINRFTAEAIFACLTNVDFDPRRFQNWINTTVELREELKKKVAGRRRQARIHQPRRLLRPGCRAWPP